MVATSPLPPASQHPNSVRTIFTRTVIFRLILGWGAYLALLAARPLLSSKLSTPALVLLLAGIITVIVVCAFGVVSQAEHLARTLGDPYGTLVLTLSIVAIEVILIAAVMLGPGEHSTIGRDSVMAVSMIIMNLVVGAALVVGGLRHRTLQRGALQRGAQQHPALRPNRTGVSAYLSLLVVLVTVAFALPGLIGREGSYVPWQSIPIAALTVLLYVFFLARQMGAQRDDFREVDPSPVRQSTASAAAPAATAVSDVDREHPSVLAIISRHRTEVFMRALVLLATVFPIVLLSHDMAALLDDGLGRAGAPVALSGVLIAMIVFLPETITTIRAALLGEMQRVSNLTHGALVSTVGLTIPAVLIIGLSTGQPVVLAETPTNLVLLGVTLLLSVATFSGKRVTPVHGGAHLMLFALYGISVFS